MKQKPIDCGTGLPPLSSNLPWLVAQNLDDTRDQTFYTIHDQLCHYKCRIPKLSGRRIRGYFHGWVILSKKNTWSLWNPMTFKTINLPPLTLYHSEYVRQCCLSSPPDDPDSVLLLMITEKPIFVYCQLGFKRDRLKWTRMSYAWQLMDITGRYSGFLQCPTVYNGKVYALCNGGDFVIRVDIIVKDGELLIKLVLFGRCPDPSERCFDVFVPLLKGSCTELFYIIVAFSKFPQKTLGNVYLFKWAMTSLKWEKMINIRNAIFFVDLAPYYSVYYKDAIVSELGGYIHIRDETGKMMYSHDFEDKTISLSSMPYSTSHVSMWECSSSRLEGNHEGSELAFDFEKENGMDDEVELKESQLLNLPFHLLETNMERCVGVEYMLVCYMQTLSFSSTFDTME